MTRRNYSYADDSEDEEIEEENKELFHESMKHMGMAIKNLKHLYDRAREGFGPETDWFYGLSKSKAEKKVDDLVKMSEQSAILTEIAKEAAEILHEDVAS